MKKCFHKTVFIFFIFLLWNYSYSQSIPNNSDKLAVQYFDQKEFDKANEYFADLYDKNQEAWYNYYFKSLIGAKDFSKAEKITKRQLKQNANNVYLFVYLGRLYKLTSEAKKEKECYEKAIKQLLPIQPHTQSLANAFIEDGLYDYAIETYNKAGKTNPDYPYFYERADVYKKKNDLKAMINEYLDALEFRETEIITVQTNLQNSLGYDDSEGGINNPLLKQELQKRIQNNPDKIVLSEFLIFIQKQQKDFNGAFIQSRALDKRLKEDGYRMFDLAKMCSDNQQWETAKRCYDYLIEKGPNNLYFDAANIESLNVEFLYTTQKLQPTVQELNLLEQKLIKAYSKYQSGFLNIPILKNLVSIQAFYLNKGNQAILLLQEFIQQPSLDKQIKAEYKLLLGDIYLLNGEIWEASLLYSQVEKDFKYEAIGQEAKFKNAKLSFYAGDFSWAKTQADVLKGATTKLIANDALNLSLIISDAIGIDTNELPLRLFASAELMAIQHKFQEAIARMDSINLLFSNNTLGDDINYAKAQIFHTQGKFTDTEIMLKNIVEYYPKELYGDDAQFKLAELYDKKINDKEKAKQAYQDLLTNYPGSIYTVEARKRFRELRGDKLNN